MAIHRIEVADPTEGDAIRAALRERGLVVVKRSVADVSGATDAALIILAADAPGGLEALSALRTVAATSVVPVILLGSPEGSGFDSARASLRGADGWYPRPVAIDRLVRKVETFLAPAESRLHALSEPALTPPPFLSRPSKGTLDFAPGLTAPERTLRLDSDGQPLMMSSIMGPPTRPPSISPTSANAFEPVFGDDSASPGRRASQAPPPASDISPLLHALLVAADQRVFPGAEPLDLGFAAGNEPPERLVPDELLEDVSAAFEMPDEDPLESFTHIGPVVSQGGTPAPTRTPSASVLASRTPGPFTPRSSRFDPSPSSTNPGLSSGTGTGSSERPKSGSGSSERPKTGSGTGVSAGGSSPGSYAGQADDLDSELDPREGPIVTTTTSARLARSASQVHRRSTLPPPARSRSSAAAAPLGSGIGTLTGDGQARSGSVGDAGLVAVLASLALRQSDGVLTISGTSPGAVEARFVLRDGDVRALVGDVARRVVAQLRRERRAVTELTDEHDAEEFLARRVEVGALAPFDLDRRLGRAREELLFELLAAPAAQFVLAPLEPSQRAALDDTPRPFARPLLALVVEGARRRLDAPRVAALLGPGSVRVVRTAELPSLLAASAAPPELAGLLTSAAGVTLEALVAAAPAEEGVVGAVYAFVCAGGLRVEAAPAVRELSGAAAERARREVAALASVTEDADYFAVLGVPRDVQPRDLHAAYVERTRALRALPLAALGLEALESTRDAILVALADALDVLADARLRARYTQALDA